MSSNLPQHRAAEVARFRHWLERTTWPRLQMAGIVIVTGAVGLLSSFLLLQGGMESMLLRYPLAIAIAYVVFLLLMWAWTRWGADATVDAADACLSTHGSGGGASGWTGTGGGSGGGGSSASWTSSSDASSASDASALDIVDADAGLPLLAALVLALVAAACVIAAGWVVWTAPMLMAELLVDSAIAAGLYKRMRHVPAQGWWWLCVRHTFWPLLGVLVFFVVLGGVADRIAPEANTLMQALKAL